MTRQRLTLGRQGEDAAADFLRRRRIKVVARNLRTPVGEIDLVARQGRDLLFIEVKTRRSAVCGTPAEAVGPRKQRQIIRAAQWYLNEGHGRGLQPRFDVIAVMLGDDGMQIEHIPAAFET